MTRAPIGSYDRFAALSTHGAHVAISGTEPGTVLELVAPGNGTCSMPVADVTVRDVRFEHPPRRAASARATASASSATRRRRRSSG